MLGSGGKIIKKSPAIIVKNFILLQVAAVLVYIAAGSIAYYAQIYRSLQLSKVLSYQIAQVLFLLGAETILVFYIFFRWYKDSYVINSGQVIHRQGIVYGKKTTISLEQIHTVSYRQGPLGKLVNYGTVELRDKAQDMIMPMRYVPDPEECVDLILSLKSGVALHGQASDDLYSLLSKDERENLEFKSTFRWDLRENKVNKSLEKATMKTVAAFLNSKGGKLVLGLDDGKKAVGLSYDFATLNKPGTDGFENHFTNVFHNMIGAEFRQLVQLSWSRQDDKELCMVNVLPSRKPVYLKTEDNEEFYIRTGNGTTSLKFSEAANYIETRFRNKLV